MKAKQFALAAVLMVCTACMLYARQAHTQDGDAGVRRRVQQVVTETTERTKCIVYDRPPRTGSTTIGRALELCLRSAGYVQQPLPKGKKGGERRAGAIRQMLAADRKEDRRALLTRHIYVSEADMQLIRWTCDDFLYITSTAPMKERLWSAAKHLLARRHGNTTSEWLDKARAAQVVRRQAFKVGELRSVNELNWYPYLTAGGEEAAVKRKLIADYVIRKASLQQDLGRLLEAFGCDASFTTRNVHEDDDVTNLDMVIGNAGLAEGDRLYKALWARAEQANEDTLEMAKTFVLDDA
ncbi:unnamed protein product [Agarophyton chilense]